MMDGNGNGERDLLVMDTTSHQEPTLSRPGDLAVFVRRTGVLGGGDLWRQQPPGAPSEKITSLGGGTPAGPVLSDGGTIYFSADSNPGGGLANLDGSEEIFSVQADGSGLTQRTSAGAGTASRRPAVSADATVVVFDSDADLDASNPDGSRGDLPPRPDRRQRGDGPDLGTCGDRQCPGADRRGRRVGGLRIQRRPGGR
ncbi:MAG: hypothetical protein Q9Q13_09970 [Acidobacteriota bacterium]|nr:hypothetical protein [Acidobacteriota bacterium]